MPIQIFTVSRDDSVYEAWPDVVLTNGGKLICVFTECTHHGNRENSRLVITESYDRGRSWSAKKPLTDVTTKDHYFNCARISKLNDGSLAIVCDRIYQDENRRSEIYLWRGDAEGTIWGEPEIIHFCAIVPDKLLQLSSGRLILGGQFTNAKTKKLEQYLIYSDDNGKTWSDAVTVAADPRYHLCEVSILECRDKTLVAFMRENSFMGYDCMKAISFDSGETWEGVFHAPIPACHRPVAGFLKSGNIMVTHRYLQGGKGWLGAWTQNVFAAFLDEESAKEKERSNQSVRIMPLDYDRSSVSDLGYTGWVQFDDGEIYVVNYIVDDAPKAQIRGYSFYESDVLIETKTD